LQPVKKQAEIDEASNIEETQSAGSAEDANNSDDTRNDVSVQDAQPQSTETSAEVSVATTRRIRRQNAGKVRAIPGISWCHMQPFPETCGKTGAKAAGSAS